jgi:phage protein D
MKPIYKITVNGNEIDFGKCLISLSVTDESGVKSDKCEIILSDRDSNISVPNTGASVFVYIGYESVGLTDVGNYTVNEITLSRPPNTINIMCHAADLKSSLKEKISDSFDSITIGSLVAQIASKHGLVPKVSSDLADIVLGHLDQTNESDMHLLTRLAKDYGAIAKPSAGNLIFALQGLAKSVSGMFLGSTTIDIKDVISWSYTESERENYGNVKSETTDFDAGEVVENVVGDVAKAAFSTLTSDNNNFETIGKAMLGALNRNSKKIQISTIGNTNLCAESRVILSGFNAGIPTNWVITKAEHRLDNNGFRSTIEGAEYDK